MKKLTLLATTAIMLSIAPAMANENQSWIDTMKTSIQNWWNGSSDETTEVEAYLDEITIAVPPMTGEEAAQIQPAAGDYVEDVQDELQNAPGSMMNDEQSFNTNFSNEGSVTAFEDTMMNADDLANIMPAAGEAEEIVDESVVVVENNAEEASETVAEHTEEAVEATHDAMESADDMAHDAMEATEEFADDVAEESEEAVEATQEIMEDAGDAAHDMMHDAHDAMHETH